MKPVDPLRSGALFAMDNDFSTLRSPVPKDTLGILPQNIATVGAPLAQNGPAKSPAANVSSSSLTQRDFHRLLKSSPMPKVLINSLVSNAAPAGTSAELTPPQLPPARRPERMVMANVAASTWGPPPLAPPISLDCMGDIWATTLGNGTAREPHSTSGSLQIGGAATGVKYPLTASALPSTRWKENAVPMRIRGWYLRRLGSKDDAVTLLAVEGLRCDAHAGGSANKPWHSTAIVERLSGRTLRTASGSTYALEGERPPLRRVPVRALRPSRPPPMSRPDAIQPSLASQTLAGPMHPSPPPSSNLPDHLVKAFAVGFPENWKELLAPGASACTVYPCPRPTHPPTNPPSHPPHLINKHTHPAPPSYLPRPQPSNLTLQPNPLPAPGSRRYARCVHD